MFKGYPATSGEAVCGNAQMYCVRAAMTLSAFSGPCPMWLCDRNGHDHGADLKALSLYLFLCVWRTAFTTTSYQTTSFSAYSPS